MKKILMELVTTIGMAMIYSWIKNFLGYFMSDNLSWVGLSLLLTYITYDLIKIQNGMKIEFRSDKQE